jgi:hypothetical protein
MNEDTKLSDLTVAEFRKLIQECLQRDMDATKEVERKRVFISQNPHLSYSEERQTGRYGLPPLRATSPIG